MDHVCLSLAQVACPFDSNGDGEIGSADLLDFLVAFGQACEDL